MEVIQFKNGQKIHIDIFQRRYTNDQQVPEKVLNITNHQGNADKTIVRYHLTPIR